VDSCRIYTTDYIYSKIQVFVVIAFIIPFFLLCDSGYRY